MNGAPTALDLAEAKRQDLVVAAALREVGFTLRSVWDLVNARVDIGPGVGVLLDWLPRTSNVRAKEGIVRALTDPKARPIAFAPLVAEFHACPDPNWGLRWAIGNALSVVADKRSIDDLVAIALDNRFGSDRMMVVRGLGRFRDPRSVGAVETLLASPDITVLVSAIAAAQTLRATSLLPTIEALSRHSDPSIAKRATRAAERLRTVAGAT